MKKIFVPLICICLLFSLIRPFLVLAAQKEQTKRAIAIVFDNSASMYERDGKAQYDWCRAIYATEVFGSMANKGDEIRVIPMNPLSIGSKDYRMDSPIIIQGGDDVTFLRDMYTEGKKNNGSLGTPIESLQVAHEELTRMSGDEKWLIVLTDGDQFQENKMPLDGDKTKQRLSTVLTDYNKSENVIFLGVGSQTVLPDVKKTGTYNNIVAKADNTEDVLSMLTQMCNAIYGRDQLSVSGEGMSFDLPMDKLIIFVQGSDLNDMKLIDQSGQVVKEPVSTTRPIYGEKGMDRDGSNWLVDYNLSGLIVTYEDIPAGNYRIHPGCDQGREGPAGGHQGRRG